MDIKDKLAPIASSLGIGSIGRHIFLCADQTKPKSPAVLERIIQGRLIAGQPVEEFVFARNASEAIG